MGHCEGAEYNPPSVSPVYAVVNRNYLGILEHLNVFQCLLGLLFLCNGAILAACPTTKVSAAVSVT